MRPNKAPSAQIVIARYKESKLFWRVFEDLAPLIVYDKSGQCSERSLPNLPHFDCQAFGGAFHAKTPTGREAHTYLFHILDLYPNFPDFTIFLQGCIADHSCSALTRIRELVHSHFAGCSYLPLGWPVDLCRFDGAPAHFGLPIRPIFERLFLTPCPEHFLYCSAALFAVSKERILARPRSFYEEMMQIIYDEPLAGYVFERLWGAVFLPKVARHKKRYVPKDPTTWQLPQLMRTRGGKRD